ncbi:MAG: hypothetical protein KF708_09880 [Pirellulales bacterium]|nr:hypothetical protein [Pirellulales bacterium]
MEETNTGLWWRICALIDAVGGSVFCFLVVAFFDVVMSGSFLFSFLICPIWFLVAVVLVLVQRPNWKVGAARVLFPVVTGILVVANSSLQGRIARANAARVIQAVDQYHQANGDYPEQLEDLVPQYLSSVPRAKYCCSQGAFAYWGAERTDYMASQRPILVWWQIPPYGRRIYSFETGEWSYLD